MAGFITRRLLVSLLLLLLLTLIVFLLFNVLPVDVARQYCGKICTPQIEAANRAKLGLDESVWLQYWHFLSGIFTGRTFGSGGAQVDCPAPCLGYSFRRNETVTSVLAANAPATISLALGAFVLWMVAGVTSGIYAALRRGRWQDKTVVGISLIGFSMPTFFLGLILIYFVVIQWELLPFPDYISPFEDPVQWFQTLLLPWITLATVTAAFYTRLTRNQMLETLGEDFVRTGRSKGLPERTVIRRHALRAGLTPIVTAAGLDLAALLGGAIITEYVFSLPGLGTLSVASVVDSDLGIIIGITLISATFVILANLVVDVLYAFVDPRVRTG